LHIKIIFLYIFNIEKQLRSIGSIKYSNTIQKLSHFVSHKSTSQNGQDRKNPNKKFIKNYLISLYPDWFIIKYDNVFLCIYKLI